LWFSFKSDDHSLPPSLPEAEKQILDAMSRKVWMDAAMIGRRAGMTAQRVNLLFQRTGSGTVESKMSGDLRLSRIRLLWRKKTGSHL